MAQQRRADPFKDADLREKHAAAARKASSYHVAAPRSNGANGNNPAQGGGLLMPQQQAVTFPTATGGLNFTTGGAAGGVNAFGATNTGAGGAAGVGFAAFGGTQAFGTPGPTSQAGFGFGTLQPQAGATIPEAKSSKEQIQNRRKVTTRKK